MDQSSSSVHARLEASRNDLLDTSMRNPLLNFRTLRSRGVEFTGVNLQDVLKRIVGEGKQFHFLPAEETPDSNPDDEPTGNDLFLNFIREAYLYEGPQPRRSPLSLQTKHPPIELEKRLLTTYHTARSFIAEQGINALYLAFGQLHWYEDDHSQIKRRSPLVLIPVELQRGTAQERFKLGYTGEEIGDNLSLSLMLKRDFGIEMPLLPEIEDLDLKGFFLEVQASILDKKRWKMETDALSLGFFSFSKFLMYKDLDVNSWPNSQTPVNHPVLRSLLVEGFKEAPSPYTEGEQLDQLVSPADVRTVVDADSSQLLTILDVKAGRNLVIQGPPGTGKSQTITNIIAEALGEGKQVLFVAEKMAALQVVKERLDRMGLGHACLELHSNKSNKKAVLEELRITQALGQPVWSGADDDLQLLLDTRDRLNAYCEAVNTPVANSGVTLHDAYGHWLRLQPITPAEAPQLELAEAESWSSLDYRQRERLVEALQAQINQMGIPAEHPFWGSERSVFLPTDAEEFRTAFSEALARTRELREDADRLADALQLPLPATAADAETLAQAVKRAIEAPPFEGVEFQNGEWLSRRADVEYLLLLGQRLCGLLKEFDPILLPEAWDADLLETRQALVNYGPKWWRFFSGEWRKAKKTLSMIHREPLPKALEEQLRRVDVVLEVRRLRREFGERQSLGDELFGAQWQGEQSHWEVLTRLLEWIAQLQETIGDGKLPQTFLDVLSGSPDLTPLKPLVLSVESKLIPYHQGLKRGAELLEWNEERRFGPSQTLSAQSFAVQEAILEQWGASVPLLHQMAAFNHLSTECRGSGLTSLVDLASSWPEAKNHLLSVFRRAYYALLIQKGLQERPSVAHFSAVSHVQALQQFRELDTRLLAHNRVKLARLHWDNLPAGKGEGQLGVLSREFQKKSRHLPIRKLMMEAGRAIQAIKPVFMMSPLSVATFLPPGSLDFDLVIFDEASQVRPVDAFGAILRGSQAVVVGDSQQLPPTSFFDALAENDDVDEENLTSDLESILGMFKAGQARERMLRWHYRSRHESLIAVSNELFYGNSLVIFPSPDASREKVGLVYHPLPDTVYDRGKSRANVEEAKVVAQAVMNHAKTEMEKGSELRHSLLVATFSVAQTEAIRNQLEVLRRQDSRFEEFFDPSHPEAFDVKNLENVQGDERDVIYISVGYGRDATGKVSMNFGPLNGKGGERRLNVLITRARLRCEVFTNLDPDDLNVSSTEALGVRALKTFLTYAKEDRLAVAAPTGREPDSPFEIEVLNALRSLGYEVVPQVGCAGYFIDMAVVNPEHPGSYLLGIECDGASYHSARSARDRDRLREQVLRSQGWKLHRIWSTDWIRHPHQLLKAVQSAIEEARQSVREVKPVTILPASPPRQEPGASEVLVRAAAERRNATVKEYQPAQPGKMSAGATELTPAQILPVIRQVVKEESPVSVEVVTRRLSDAAGILRVTERLRQKVEEACGWAVRMGEVRRQGDFLWLPEMTEPPLRSRAHLPASEKKLEVIAPEEIQSAVLFVLNESFGMSVEDLPRSVVRLLGFERMTEGMKGQVEGEVQQLLAEQRVVRHGDQLLIPESG
jgi:very-short-patch-repair endonuclease/DNA polymerase III delta prime subunit